MTTLQLSLHSCYFMELRSIWGAPAFRYFTELQAGSRLGQQKQGLDWVHQGKAGQTVLLSRDGHELIIKWIGNSSSL